MRSFDESSENHIDLFTELYQFLSLSLKINLFHGAMTKLITCLKLMKGLIKHACYPTFYDHHKIFDVYMTKQTYRVRGFAFLSSFYFFCETPVRASLTLDSIWLILIILLKHFSRICIRMLPLLFNIFCMNQINARRLT